MVSHCLQRNKSSILEAKFKGLLDFTASTYFIQAASCSIVDEQRTRVQWSKGKRELHQQCIAKREGNINRTAASDAAVIHKKGGKHHALQKFGLIDIWTAAEFRQTNTQSNVAQMASIT